MALSDEKENPVDRVFKAHGYSEGDPMQKELCGYFTLSLRHYKGVEKWEIPAKKMRQSGSYPSIRLWTKLEDSPYIMHELIYFLMNVLAEVNMVEDQPLSLTRFKERVIDLAERYKKDLAGDEHV